MLELHPGLFGTIQSIQGLQDHLPHHGRADGTPEDPLRLDESFVHRRDGGAAVADIGDDAGGFADGVAGAHGIFGQEGGGDGVLFEQDFHEFLSNRGGVVGFFDEEEGGGGGGDAEGGCVGVGYVRGEMGVAFSGEGGVLDGDCGRGRWWMWM